MMRTAEKLREVSERTKVPVIYKSSFMKDNRSSVEFYMGPGLDEGLKVLERVKKEFGFPLLTDVHYPTQVKAAAEVCDVLQIPAYLCMQTTLVTEAAKTGAVINLKHGQFLAPDNMVKPVKKIESVGNDTYPHIYGALNPAAVVQAVPLDRNGRVETVGSLFVKEMGLRMGAAVVVMALSAIGLVVGGSIGAQTAGGQFAGLLVGAVFGALLVWSLARRRAG